MKEKVFIPKADLSIPKHLQDDINAENKEQKAERIIEVLYRNFKISANRDEFNDVVVRRGSESIVIDVMMTHMIPSPVLAGLAAQWCNRTLKHEAVIRMLRIDSQQKIVEVTGKTPLKGTGVQTKVNQELKRKESARKQGINLDLEES